MKTVKIIPSKSDAHRAYISAALAGDSFDCVICEETSEDIEATKACLRGMLAGDDDLYCGESGSTLRFLLPVVGALGTQAVFHPEGRLIERPMTPLVDELSSHGMSIRREDSKIIADGMLTSGSYKIPGNISSQFISGLLFALPLLDGDSEIIVEGELESSPYVDMTVDTLGKFGIAIEDETIIEFLNPDLGERPDNASGDNHAHMAIRRIFYVKGNQKYIAPANYIVQGDWSNAAFWFAMGALGKEPIRVEGLSAGTYQGDERIWDAIDVFGIEYKFGPNYVEVYPSRERMKGITWDARETPDMVPVLALMGALAEGETRIVNAARLRLKESDRLRAVSETLRGLGVDVEELSEGLVVHGCAKLSTATLDSHGDHRIAMMIAAASVSMEDGDVVKLSGWKAANKSYPSFFRIMSELDLDGHLELV